MKQSAFLAVAILGITQLVSAGPCVPGSLTSYIALPSSGCTIGNNTLSGFQTFPTGTAGFSEISAANVTITPLGGNLNPGLMEQATASAPDPNGKGLEIFINYMIAGNLYTNDQTTLSNTTGIAANAQDFCVGGKFTGANAVSGCTGTAGQLLAFGNASDQKALTPKSLLSVTDQLSLDPSGATGGTIVDQFTAASAVPEPATCLLMGFGMALVAFRKSRLLTNSRRND